MPWWALARTYGLGQLAVGRNGAVVMGVGAGEVGQHMGITWV